LVIKTNEEAYLIGVRGSSKFYGFFRLAEGLVVDVNLEAT
jgi:hypothetical protein